MGFSKIIYAFGFFHTQTYTNLPVFSEWSEYNWAYQFLLDWIYNIYLHGNFIGFVLHCIKIFKSIYKCNIIIRMSGWYWNPQDKSRYIITSFLLRRQSGLIFILYVIVSTLNQHNNTWKGNHYVRYSVVLKYIKSHWYIFPLMNWTELNWIRILKYERTAWESDSSTFNQWTELESELLWNHSGWRELGIELLKASRESELNRNREKTEMHKSAQKIHKKLTKNPQNCYYLNLGCFWILDSIDRVGCVNTNV